MLTSDTHSYAETHGDGDRYHVHVHTNSRDRLRFLLCPHFDTTDRYISMERKELGDVAS